jgi:hypothetical protein
MSWGYWVLKKGLSTSGVHKEKGSEKCGLRGTRHYTAEKVHNGIQNVRRKSGGMYMGGATALTWRIGRNEFSALNPSE